MVKLFLYSFADRVHTYSTEAIIIVYTSLIHPGNIATSCWSIVADIPKTRIKNPNAVKFGDVVGHTV